MKFNIGDEVDLNGFASQYTFNNINKKFEIDNNPQRIVDGAVKEVTRILTDGYIEVKTLIESPLPNLESYVGLIIYSINSVLRNLNSEKMNQKPIETEDLISSDVLISDCTVQQLEKILEIKRKEASALQDITRCLNILIDLKLDKSNIIDKITTIINNIGVKVENKTFNHDIRFKTERYTNNPIINQTLYGHY